ncbi:38949_t:CDS:2 [Gigaspora margarita]|uniref:38949_t:CDS:1 n=1 Tax=Gigaspora margarita TaxID=4874 RepID=A0ABN7UUF9_GIGMA|nr:38949_t:CDS:2 [Gigaspora margarita]
MNIKNHAASSWTEHYICSCAGTKQERSDCIEGGHTQKKWCTQKVSKKVGCKCDLRIHYFSNIFCNEVVIVRYQYKHNGHIPGSHNDVQFLKKSEETIAKIKMFAQQGLSLSAIRHLMKAPEEVIERYFTSKDIVPNRDKLLTYEDIYNIFYKEIYQKYCYNNIDAISVLQWVDILKKNKENLNNLNNPILSHFQMYNNNRQMFQLGFHTSWQYKLYQDHNEIIHIDSTHNTNAYKYALFTILIRHPYSSHGVPLAWLLTESYNDEAEINAIHATFPYSNIFLSEDHDNLFYDLEQLLNIDNESSVDFAITQFEEKWKHTPASEDSLVDIDDSSIFCLQNSIFIIKSTQDNNNYIVEHYNSDLSFDINPNILEVNSSIDQWIEHLAKLCYEANLDDIPLNEKKRL